VIRMDPEACCSVRSLCDAVLVFCDQFVHNLQLFGDFTMYEVIGCLVCI
jgi:hypothetical protein